MRTSAELREGFLAFFESKGHTRVPSASLVPRADDRTTLLTTAGMQPMMPYFLGLEQPPAQLLTTSQKSFRTQDIEEVGLDAHHLTFFEMLGNFSFGQYFKEGAIEFAREFVLELDAARLGPHLGDRACRRSAAEARSRRGCDRALAASGHADRADRAAADGRELLVGGRPGTVRPGLRDLLRLGRGARLRRARLRAGLPALRTVPRVLEPRLHGLRATRQMAR